ncbi:DMT family transporter [Thalassotalea euphylliae]|uniref:DMT family transporter n=1 Tax=Thalassotalea euphylliae TaxID=1655234 RepID=A0A3E0TQ11_9GAMM|nr:DMT family transporter [Thalassotalea euphylliae]REL26533.1 DMT family transporter [Thalassotalea euphylliae]
METWIAFTLLAAFMQAVRTAGQKQLSAQLSSIATAGVRYIFALPFAWLYLWWALEYYQVAMPELNDEFLQYAIIASFAQLIGTACLVVAFQYRNFAVATSLAKTEAIQVAVIGALLFAAPLSGYGWLSVILGVVGVILLSKVKFSVKDVLMNPGAGYGLASGLGLAITTLLIRESNLALGSHPMVSAAVTLVFLISAQSLLSALYLLARDAGQFRNMIRHWRLALFVGITSLLGSIGWFTAVSYQTAAYVKALGQVEFFITLILTYRIFKEKTTLVEIIGMLLIIISVVVLLLLA